MNLYSFPKFYMTICYSHFDGSTWPQFRRVGEKRKCTTHARKYCLRKLLVFLTLHINFDDIYQAYHYLVNQDGSAWTWELDRESAFR